MHKITILICFIFSLISCSTELVMDEQHEIVTNSYILYTLDGSPYHIYEDLVIPEGYQWIVEPGVEIIIHEDVNVEAFANVTMIGTETMPIKITPFVPTVGWGKIHMAGPASRLRLHYVEMTDGILTSAYTANEISNSTFVNTQDLDWQYAILRFWEGSVEIHDCSFTGINEAEGILIHEVPDVKVYDNYVFRVQDGIELIDGIGGEIYNNTIVRCLDDGVDLNNCTGTRVYNNHFMDIRDAAMEIGSNGFGSTLGVEIYDNRYEECNRGILLKESSTAHVLRDTFVANTLGVDVITEDEDAEMVSDIILEKCIFINNVKDTMTDDRSIITVIN